MTYNKEYQAVYQPAYRAANREWLRVLKREGMRQKRATDLDYRNRELAQQCEHRRAKQAAKKRCAEIAE
jgi:hypothetical protein